MARPPDDPERPVYRMACLRCGERWRLRAGDFQQGGVTRSWDGPMVARHGPLTECGCGSVPGDRVHGREDGGVVHASSSWDVRVGFDVLNRIDWPDVPVRGTVDDRNWCPTCSHEQPLDSPDHCYRCVWQPTIREVALAVLHEAGGVMGNRAWKDAIREAVPAFAAAAGEDLLVAGGVTCARDRNLGEVLHRLNYTSDGKDRYWSSRDHRQEGDDRVWEYHLLPAAAKRAQAAADMWAQGKLPGPGAEATSVRDVRRRVVKPDPATVDQPALF